MAVTAVAADSRSRRLIAFACAVFALVGAVAVAASVRGESLRTVTAGRSTLVDATFTVFKNHPVAGVGVGGQPAASREEARRNASVRRNASHTTPLTIAAEQGVIGLTAYVAFLLAAAATLRAAVRRDRPLGLGLAAVFAVLFVQSLLYSGFFEDPLTWGTVAVVAAALAVRAPVAHPVALDRRQPEPRPSPGVAAR